MYVNTHFIINVYDFVIVNTNLKKEANIKLSLSIVAEVGNNFTD